MKKLYPEVLVHQFNILEWQIGSRCVHSHMCAQLQFAWLWKVSQTVNCREGGNSFVMSGFHPLSKQLTIFTTIFPLQFVRVSLCHW